MKKVVIALLVLVAAVTIVAWPTWNGAPEPAYQGWIEADLVFVGPDEAGRIVTLSVREGDHVDERAPLFTLDDDLQQADVNQVKAQVTNARQTLDRAQTLVKSNAGTQRAVDDAEMTMRTAEARLNSAQTRLARRQVFSPVTGSVQQIYFRQGELAGAGRPVVALLPPANIKVRFFVPEARLPEIAIGETVRIKCDGCAAEIAARVTFMSRTAEYTPPVIYSSEERAKLVFMIEARPTEPDRLRVGQPVSVALGAGEPREARAKR
jgi:HlyD family secretion protein